MRVWIVTLSLLMAFSFSMCACSHENEEPEIKEDPTPTPEPDADPTTGHGKVLVAYFSCTNTTKKVAGDIADSTSAALFHIEPQQAYTSADLDYNSDCRANREQNNPSTRPAIKGMPENLDKYDVVFLGYPIWWGKAPRVIFTFLESGDFKGKTIIPFCTSHSSGIGNSDTELHSAARDAVWKSGERFGGGASTSEIEKWINGLGIDFEKQDLRDSMETDYAKFPLSEGKNGQAPTIRLSSGYDMPVVGLGTYSLTGDVCVNSVKSAIGLGFRNLLSAGKCKISDFLEKNFFRRLKIQFFARSAV